MNRTLPTNPYQSPTSIEDSRQVPVSSVARAAFFGVNFVGGILLLASSLISIVAPFVGAGSPFAFLGGIFVLVPCSAFVIAEWVAFYRNNRRVERVMGRIMFCLAFLTVMAVAANVGEAVFPTKPDRSAASREFMAAFVLLGATIALYFGACGGFRTRQSIGRE